MKKHIFRTALALTVLLLAGSCEQSAGTGKEPITLKTAADLAKIGADPDYPVDGDYTLEADLTLENWTPVGTYEKPFAGTFNGGGRTLTLNNGGGGAFGFTDGAVISNVIVAGTIHAVREGTVQAGGVVDNAKNTQISFCVSSVNIAAEGQGYNSSAGGIAGFMRDNSTVTDCYATGNITLRCMDIMGLSHAGGIAGYQGAGTAGAGSSSCVISRCYFTGSVEAEGNFPYAGGIAGYNYTGSIIRECYSTTGTVTATGENLPYAGGIAGYNSQNTEYPALIEDCYSSMTVNAVSAAKQALAGGITGANAQDAVVSNCYALGAVTATVDGSSATDAGGSIGPPAMVNAGGIAGAQYVLAPSIRNCVALNAAITGADSGSGAAYNVHRIAGPGADLEGVIFPGDCVWESNIANVAAFAAGGMDLAPEPDGGGYDGADCEAQPGQSAYAALGWDFDTVWEMGGEGCPVLRWQ
jgi:hypothetical protein